MLNKMFKCMTAIVKHSKYAITAKVLTEKINEISKTPKINI